MMKYIKEIVPYIIIILVVVFVKAFIISPIRVNGTSMYSTLDDGDIMILNKVIYNLESIKRFDIVVIKTDNSNIIKRIIGLPGDTVEYKNNILYINGKKTEENYTRAVMRDYNIEELGNVKVPKNKYFVLGDNRLNSVDSRYYGFIDRKNILGRAKLVILPFKRFGNKN